MKATMRIKTPNIKERIEAAERIENTIASLPPASGLENRPLEARCVWCDFPTSNNYTHRFPHRTLITGWCRACRARVECEMKPLPYCGTGISMRRIGPKQYAVTVSSNSPSVPSVP